jgi:Spy/CpxP family protein refolding chaperone
VKTQLLLTSIILATLLSFGAQAQGGAPIPPGMMPAPIRGLNLTQEQKEKFAAMRNKNHAEMSALNKALNDKRDAFEKLFASSASDADLRKAQADLQELTNRMITKHFENSLEMRALLTAEQRKDMLEKMRERKESFPGVGLGPRNGIGRGMHRERGMGTGAQQPGQ